MLCVYMPEYGSANEPYLNPGADLASATETGSCVGMVILAFSLWMALAASGNCMDDLRSFHVRRRLAVILWAYLGLEPNDQPYHDITLY